MDKSPVNQLKDSETGEHADPRTIPDPPKRKPGRPVGTTKGTMQARAPAGLDKAKRDQWTQRKVIDDQRLDCRRLQKVIKDATPGTQDPKDIASLSRSTAILHDLQRAAYDFGATPGQVKAVIIVQAPAPSMDSWQGEADTLLGRVVDAVAGTDQRIVEADVMDEPAGGESET